jgi:GTPase
LAHDYKVIREELRHYKVDLSPKPEIVAVNKIDAILPEELAPKIKSLQKAVGKDKKVILFSAVAHKNLSELLHAIEAMVRENPKEEPAPKKTYKVFTIEDVQNNDRFDVVKEDEFFRISGPKIEKFAVRTDFASPHAVARFRDILKKMGIDKELKRCGAEEGSKIVVMDKKFIL